MSVLDRPAEPLPESQPFIDPHGGEPLRTGAFGEQHLERYARELARASRMDGRPPARQPLLRRFAESGRFLEKAHRQISEAFRNKESLSADAEWLLDNYHVIANVVREV